MLLPLRLTVAHGLLRGPHRHLAVLGPLGQVVQVKVEAVLSQSRAGARRQGESDAARNAQGLQRRAAAGAAVHSFHLSPSNCKGGEPTDRLCEVVEVHIVELQQIVRRKAPKARHGAAAAVRRQQAGGAPRAA